MSAEGHAPEVEALALAVRFFARPGVGFPDVSRCRHCAQPVWELMGLLCSEVKGASCGLGAGSDEDEVQAALRAGAVGFTCPRGGQHERGYTSADLLQVATRLLVHAGSAVEVPDAQLEVLERLVMDGTLSPGPDLLAGAIALAE